MHTATNIYLHYNELYEYKLSVPSCIYGILDSVAGLVICGFIISQSGMATICDPDGHLVSLPAVSSDGLGHSPRGF